MIVINQKDNNVVIPRGLVAPTGGQGSDVSWNQIATGGTKIAEISIDGTSTDVFAPSGTSMEEVNEAIGTAMEAEITRVENIYAKKKNA